MFVYELHQKGEVVVFFYFLCFYFFTKNLIKCSKISFFEKRIFFYKCVIIVMRLWIGWIKQKVSVIANWAVKKREPIFVGIIIATLMGSLLLVQDIKNTSREVEHYREKLELANIAEAQSQRLKEIAEFSDFLFKVNQDLRQRVNAQQSALEEASIIINNQRAMLEKLIEYMKRIGEWPPKIDPPKPIDPDSIAGTRSEA